MPQVEDVIYIVCNCIKDGQRELKLTYFTELNYSRLIELCQNKIKCYIF